MRLCTGGKLLVGSSNGKVGLYGISQPVPTQNLNTPRFSNQQNEANSGDAGGDGTAVWNDGNGLLMEKLSAACSSGVRSCGIDFITMLMLFGFVG